MTRNWRIALVIAVLAALAYAMFADHPDADTHVFAFLIFLQLVLIQLRLKEIVELLSIAELMRQKEKVELAINNPERFVQVLKAMQDDPPNRPMQ